MDYVRAGAWGMSGNQVTVSRALLGLGRRQVARFYTSDRLDLRRRNLEVGRGNAKRNDIADNARVRDRRAAA